MPFRLPPEQWFPAGVASLSARYVARPDGTRLRIVETPPGEGPPIVLVHGWGCSAFTWRHILPQVVAAGRRAIAVDLPGHGLSDKPDAEAAYTTGEMARAVLELLDAEGWDEVVLVGHSMGGAIAREVALAAPSRIAALALLAPAGFGRIRRLATGRALSPDWTVPLLTPLAVPRWAVRRSMQRTYGARGGFTEAEVDEYWSPTQFPGFLRASRHLLHHFAWDPPPPTAFAVLRETPLLVLLGGMDRLVVSRDVARYAEQVPHAEVIWLPEAGHALHEDSPAETWRHVDALLRAADASLRAR